RAREMVAQGDADAALILPDEDESATTPIAVIVNRNVPLVGQLAASGARTLATRVAAASHADLPPPAVITVDVDGGKRSLSGAELYGPVIGIFFLFLTAGFVARSLQEEREQGTLARLRSIPISAGTIAFAKVLTVVIVGGIELAIVFLIMGVLYGAQWGSLAAVALIGFAITLAVGSIALLIAALARTSSTAHNLEVIVALGFAVLGGSLVPLHNLPDAARPIAAVTPNGVAIRALRDVAANGYGVRDVLGPVFVILLFTLFFASIGQVLVRRAVDG
ncbi:MAG: ABC transporter permease, partial [Actinomycetota bacterium]|nr:ABC transporter permease [Actinomycetota bacterium]